MKEKKKKMHDPKMFLAPTLTPTNSHSSPVHSATAALLHYCTATATATTTTTLLHSALNTCYFLRLASLLLVDGAKKQQQQQKNRVAG